MKAFTLGRRVVIQDAHRTLGCGYIAAGPFTPIRHFSRGYKKRQPGYLVDLEQPVLSRDSMTKICLLYVVHANLVPVIAGKFRAKKVV